MNVFELGRICVKTSGRDAGLKCIVIGSLDKNYVLVDGQTRRKRCNVNHLEPLGSQLDIKNNASHEEVKAALSTLGIETIEKKAKSKVTKPIPKRKRETAEKETDSKKAPTA